MGMGIAIVPRDWTNLIPTTNLKIIEISELPLNTGTIIAWMKNSYLSSVARHFLETF
jgi:DNA-binding transcriptional LysR family regulator